MSELSMSMFQNKDDLINAMRSEIDRLQRELADAKQQCGVLREIIADKTSVYETLREAFDLRTVEMADAGRRQAFIEAAEIAEESAGGSGELLALASKGKDVVGALCHSEGLMTAKIIAAALRAKADSGEYSYGVAEGYEPPKQKGLWMTRHAISVDGRTETVEFVRRAELEQLRQAIDEMRPLVDKLRVHGVVMGDDIRRLLPAFDRVILCLGDAYTERK